MKTGHHARLDLRCQRQSPDRNRHVAVDLHDLERPTTASSSITGTLPRTYSYDTAGNTLTYANVTATYNNRGRMKTVTNGAVTTTICYNALGQRVKRAAARRARAYVYDEAGHLLGEYDATGALIQETIWMGDTPVATLRPGTPVVIYYVHTDHLNTPRRVTRPSDNKLMWTWDADPFGTSAERESGIVGTFKYNLRFPGQLYDSHAGLNQNYFRDYDPAIGRYVESDPIGLAGRNEPVRLCRRESYFGFRSIRASRSCLLPADSVGGRRRGASLLHRAAGDRAEKPC